MQNNYPKLTLSTKIPFGKYKGELVYDVIKEDLSYIQWLSTKWEGEIDYKVKAILTEATTTTNKEQPGYLPKTNIPITKPDYTSNIEGLDITVTKPFLMYKENQIIHYYDLFKHFTSFMIGKLFEKQYLQIK